MSNEYNSQEPLLVEDTAKGYLAEAAKWGRFLSIVGFVMIGIIVLLGLFFGIVASNAFPTFTNQTVDFPGPIFGIMYLLMAGIYVYPTLKLFNFSKNIRTALAANDSNMLTESLGNLKSVFKFFGIVTIVFISLYALMFLIALAVGAGGLIGR